MAIAGVPSMVNDFTGGSFMETHYHSQFDNDEFYDEQVYRLHHELFALLILALDETAVVPLQFSPVVQRIRKGLEQCREICYRADVAGQLGEKKRVLLEKIEELESLSDRALRRCREEYEAVEEYNRNYKQLLRDGKYDEAEGLSGRPDHWNRSCLQGSNRSRTLLCGLTGTEMCCILMRYAVQI